MLKRNLDRRLRSSGLRNGLAIAVLAIALLLGVAHERGLWQAGNLLGTARWDVRSPELLQRVSLSRLGTEGNSDSFAASISGDGRYIVFLSTADNLVEDDLNGFQDVFLYDRVENETSRLSMGFNGREANGPSSEARISRDGRFVVFVSEASNLVQGDNNGFADVFLLARESGEIRLVSVAADGTQGNDRSVQPDISTQGRFVTFISLAENLHAGDSNGVSDAYLYDSETGTLELASVNSAGEQANQTSKYAVVSSNGRYVAFQSKATNLVEGDYNNMYDIYVRDRQQGVTTLVSRGVDGVVGNMESQRPSLSDDGRYVAFESWASNLVSGDENYNSDVFVADRATGRMTLISVGNDGQQADHVNGGAVISGDGRYVAFSSLAGNMAEGDNNQAFDVYVRDRHVGRTQLVSVNLNGQAGSGASISPSLAAGGNYIVFDSVATDLVPNDGNERVDVFIFNAPAPAGNSLQSIFLPLAISS